MRFFTFHALCLATLGGLTAAKCCKNGINYCGSGLLNKGNYYGEITTALNNAGLPNDSDHIYDTLFHCGACTDTPVVKYCGKGACKNGGAGKDDYC
ncbi:hypothetical protein DE146DRAFT_609054 [Phaeosphaeria sp. MPI-PUGE-AT-0046c]|nr:hypothetical protein DE146DRAFT_609054 [Phaeosphaeria sp. MPI-PUGE-AT-0046c]